LYQNEVDLTPVNIKIHEIYGENIRNIANTYIHVIKYLPEKILGLGKNL